MTLTLLQPLSEAYLASDAVINFTHPAIQEKAQALRGKTTTESIENCYLWVRDHVAHSVDIAEKQVISVTASQTLLNGHGLCMAKAHLLAALLRALGIPAGLCYQTLVQKSIQFVHGLNAVYYADRKEWYRIDAVGRRAHAPLPFKAYSELLFYTPTRNLSILEHPEVYVSPHPTALAYLGGFSSLSEALEHLPEHL